MHKDGLNAVLHCHESNGREGDAHSFFFSYGCVVTWGLSEGQERERLKLLTTAGCVQVRSAALLKPGTTLLMRPIHSSKKIDCLDCRSRLASTRSTTLGTHTRQGLAASPVS